MDFLDKPGKCNMEDSNTFLRQEFFNSLDMEDGDIEAFMPLILEDLWELGSMPEYIIALIKKQGKPESTLTITDLGCGKGAVLIKLAMEMDVAGLGIDWVPQFILASLKYATYYRVDDSVKFRVGDIRDAITRVRNQDYVIYGYDSEVLGNVKESLLQLGNCLRRHGGLILEVAFTQDDKDRISGIPNKKELYRQLEESGLEIVDEINWNKED